MKTVAEIMGYVSDDRGEYTSTHLKLSVMANASRMSIHMPFQTVFPSIISLKWKCDSWKIKERSDMKMLPFSQRNAKSKNYLYQFDPP